MADVEIAQRTRELSGLARNFVNDRDGYRTVKKAGLCNTFPRGILIKSTGGGVAKSATRIEIEGVAVATGHAGRYRTRALDMIASVRPR